MAAALEVSQPTLLRAGNDLTSLCNHEFVHGAKYKEQQTRVSPQGCDPQLFHFAQTMVKRFAAMGIPLFVHCYVRSGAEQDRLKAAGRSKAAAGQSPHQGGFAVDIIHGVAGWNLDKKQWALIGSVGKSIAKGHNLHLVWGGDWNFYDPAHWELRDWRKR